MLGKGATKAVQDAVDALFDRIKARFLGPKLASKSIVVGYDHALSLPGLYEAAAKDSGAAPSDTTLNAILQVASDYIEAQRAKAKAEVVNNVNSFLADAKQKGVDASWRTALEGQLSGQFESITNEVKRIVDSESQNGRAVGALEGITQVNAQVGVDDPIVFFVIVRDDNVCKECMRLHMLEDGTTPRLWYLSEVGNGFHKRGDSSPKVRGLHPHCRCTMTTLMPGWGFDKAGSVTWIGPDHDEISSQRGSLKKAQGLDDFIASLHSESSSCCVELAKSEDVDFSELDKFIRARAP
jgi:hypothetical protein